MSVVPSLLVLLFIHTADLCRTLKPVKNHVLIGHVIKTMQESSFEICTYHCELDDKCFSVNIYTKTRKCEINYGTLPLEALGIEDDNKIFDGQLTSSSAHVGYEAWRGRLHGQGSWKPVKNYLSPSYNVSFPYSTVNITYIATQGAPTEDCWMTSFKLQYRIQDGSLKDYLQTIAGNTDRNTVIYHPLKPALTGVKLLSIRPSSSHGCIALRLELYK
ncbi:hypothetical protein OS493_031268 [Desmophyllum pertusum]|uniref:Apple domain-containing protein n=1 Tax=Desmophyllum pertusum TaxID=174260 RepID=A0A9X0CVD0_9CNID|nr:hypothetical protein OS493_031268 [Desmophyllum pertusum]